MTSKNSEKLGTVESKVPPMKVSVLIDNDVVEIIPDTRIKREFATPERCLNSEISELDAVVASLLPKKLQITANRAGKSVRGPPNRRVPPSDWEFHTTDAASYLIVREENNPLFVREYISENKKVFQCCYCLRDENGAKSVCATATKNGEGKFVVIAALAQAHCKKCSLIPYEKCVKFRDTSETTKRCRPEGSRSSVLKANTKIKQNALKAAQLGSIKFILENLSAHKPTLESQEAGELEQSLPSTTSVPPAQVKVFKLQSNRYLQIPDSDWEYIPGSRGEPNGMILVKNSNNLNVREFRFLKATNNEAKKEYYCCKCLVLGRMIKIIIETSDMGKETAKMLKTKPHHFQCKGIPSGVYMKNKEQLAESAKINSNTDENNALTDETVVKMNKTSEGLVDGQENTDEQMPSEGSKDPECVSFVEKLENSDWTVSPDDWRLGFGPNGEPNARLFIKDPKNEANVCEYKLIEDLPGEKVFRCVCCENLKREIVAVLSIVEDDKVSVISGSRFEHDERCTSQPLVSVMKKQLDLGTKAAENRRLNSFELSGSSDGIVNGSTPFASDILSACLDLETLDRNRWTLLRNEADEPRLWIRSPEEDDYGYDFWFWKDGGAAGLIFLCHGCKIARKRTKAFLQKRNGESVVLVDEQHHSRCSSKNFSCIGSDFR